MTAALHFTGQREMARKIRQLAKVVAGDVERALVAEGEDIMTRSKREFVPVDTGTLRSSGRVGKAERRGKTVSVTLSYGGAAAEYAIIVHENLDAHHPVGQAKYLEQPLMEAIPGMSQRIASAVRLKP